MDFVISALGMPFNGETIKNRSLGGSESAAYYLGRELAAMGHRVTMFTNSTDEGTWDGVQYVHAGQVKQDTPLGDRFTFYATNTPHDVLIIQRHPLAFHKDYASKVNVLQLHDLALHRYLSTMQGGFGRLDFITTVSEWHAEQVGKVYEVDRAAIRVVRNGVDLSLYGEPFDETELPEPLRKGSGTFRLLYQSRPERGLEHLVRPGGIMDRLRGTDVQLFFCGYENTTQEMAAYYAQLNAWAAALPNCTNLGALTKADLAKLQQSCDLLVYPTEFEEVSCITAMEAMAAALPMVTSACAALPETCGTDSGTELIPLKEDGKADEDAFVAFIKLALEDLDNPDREGASITGRMALAQERAASRVGWKGAAQDLLRHVDEHMANRRANPDRVLRHCIEHSDIAFMDWYLEHEVADEPSAIGKAAVEERAKMFKFIESGIEEHYAYWEGLNCDKLGLSYGGDYDINMIVGTPRFRGILSLLGELRQKLGRPLRVLEFGCAHGHIILNLAKSFPDCEFTGVDFMGKSVGIAIELAQKTGVSNAVFGRANYEDLAQFGEFDVVIAAEVIEHIYDYLGALERLRARVKIGGAMIFTTPMGRWEWSGHDNFRYGREHLHHFERDDWRDIVGNHPDYHIVYAPAEPEATGQFRGSWLLRVNLRTDEPFRPVDYARKLKALAPRETVSLCLIAKDAEDSLRKCISSAAFFVDQVVISVDKASTDDTEGVIMRLEAEFPHLPFTVIEHEPALEAGFAAARNGTLDHAAGDWVLWMDTDEVCPQARNIWRLLKPSPFNAYACPQIHYSVQPAQVLTTDFPARLFRANRGVRFFGLVHEHPEEAPGKSISRAMMASDVQFLHSGYIDEVTRRARYARNLPLLIRDAEAHPDRLLNKFLLVRDYAQGLQFDQLSGRGDVTRMLGQANDGVRLTHEMIDNPDFPLRMVMDSLQYYSILNEFLGVGFSVKLNWSTVKPPFESMNSSGSIEARFHDRATYFKLLNRIAEETTKNYESKYC